MIKFLFNFKFHFKLISRAFFIQQRIMVSSWWSHLFGQKVSSSPLKPGLIFCAHFYSLVNNFIRVTLNSAHRAAFKVFKDQEVMTFAKPSNFWSKAVQVVAEAGRTGNLDELQVMDLKQVYFYKRALLFFSDL